uniref:Actin-related protein 2/3 complex subunit 5 n=1 Tax=Mesocestoides corti TaxID=53468 RepID=A0A0R3UB88_MESCO
LAFTDLSQVSSSLSSFSSPLPPPPSPPRVQAQNSKPLLACDRFSTTCSTRFQSSLFFTHAAYALLTISEKVSLFPLSGKWKSIGVSVSGSLDGVELRSSENCNNENKQNSAIEKRPEEEEEIFARLAELRRRNDLLPLHLRTNYPVETQVCNAVVGLLMKLALLDLNQSWN